ncbi:MAG: ATP-binding protein [Lachnospiraceae bacterium]|jgi:predicted ATPase|nr:ATP-binding protein [Lachnospiraceae bacterium]
MLLWRWKSIKVAGSLVFHLLIETGNGIGYDKEVLRRTIAVKVRWRAHEDLGRDIMQIKLKNIGIVKDSEIVLDGLTVITGKNNSGKSTVGKTLYSLLDGVCNLQAKAQSDKAYYIRKQLTKIENILEIFRFLRYSVPDAEGGLRFFSSYPALVQLVSGTYKRELHHDEVEQFAHDVEGELIQFDWLLFEKSPDFEKFRRPFSLRLRGQKETDYAELFRLQREQALTILDKLFYDVGNDPELIRYARESINQTLQMEFSNQIQPVKGQDGPSEVELLEGDSVCFRLTVSDNAVVDDGFPVFRDSPYEKVYLIDDPFILDDLDNFIVLRDRGKEETDSILNSSRIHSHNFRLKNVLRAKKTVSVFEQTVLDDSLKTVKEQIDKILPGTFEFSSGGEYYVQNGSKLKLSNLATGSKMFSMIKLLLEKGELDDRTMLILDEPEAHLHPMWQNSFAEIIILLVKELGVNILLTTHSSNFVLALDAYMREYKIADQTNFYQTNALPDGFVQYFCVNDDMGTIYQDFMQYLSEVKMLRSRCLYDAEEPL